MNWLNRARVFSARLQWQTSLKYGRLVRFFATAQARAKMRSTGTLKLLVDSTILARGITHESAWISTGIKKWGNLEIATGHMARVPVYAKDCDHESFPEIKYLPGVAHLARLGHLQLFTSAELRAEQWRQPTGRFKGHYYDDLNLFADVRMETIDGYHLDLNDARQAQLQRVAACREPLFQSLLGILGEKNSLDAYHIFTAEKHQLDGFLHLDLTLNRLLAQNRANPVLSSLRTKVLIPSALGARLGLWPMDPRLLSYEDASSFVRSDLHLPDQKRRKPGKTTR